MSSSSPLNAVIVRISGEIPIKSEAVRSIWERKLYHRIISKVDRLGKVERRRGFFYVKTSAPYLVINRLRPVFGLSSLIPARLCYANLEEIKLATLDIANHYYSVLSSKGAPPESFAIITKKVISESFGTTEIRYEVGQYVKDNLNLKVNLKHPDLPIYVEVRNKEAFVYSEIIEAAGGLPVGVQDRVILLVGLDKESMATMWLLMKRGCPVTAIHFSLCKEKKVDELKEIIHVLFNKSCENQCRLHVIDIGKEIDEIMLRVPRKMWWVMILKLMVSLAEERLKNEKAKGIALGLRGILDEALVRKIMLLKSNITALHYPILTYTKSDLHHLINKIHDITGVEIRDLKETCHTLKKIKEHASVPEINEFYRYWNQLRDVLNLPH